MTTTTPTRPDTTQAVDPLQVGQPAPDLTLTDAQGALIPLSSLWAAQPIVLVFTRHLG